MPLEGTFTYSVPAHLCSSVVFGIRVIVPFGKSKTYVAVVVAQHDNAPDFDVKDILDVVDDQPVVMPLQWRLWSWVADYYIAPLGNVYKAAMPAGLKAEDGYRPKMETWLTLADNLRHDQALHLCLDSLKRSKAQLGVMNTFLEMSHWDTIDGSRCEVTPVDVTREELTNEARCSTTVLKALVDKGFLVAYEREVARINISQEPHLERAKRLSVAQQEAYNQVLFQWLRKNVVLLHGVTSSGKTEIYIHLIIRALQEKKQVLYLLPEIALTVQIMQRLRSIFGDRLGIYHSKYSDAERVEIWKKQMSGHPYDIILGARSAVLLPFQNLGLVIVDEEHESSFKQQDPSPRYHARSVAIMLAHMTGAKTLLGSATPSAESYHNASTGKYGLVRLTTRYADLQMPKVLVVDIKDLQRRKMMVGPFSPTLMEKVNGALAAKEQVILFQNRRGFAPMIECRTCGWVPKCQNCDVSLTYHMYQNVLTCHYCGYTYRVPDKCPNCEGTELKSVGYGTEKVEENIRHLLPNSRIARMDLDTARTRSAYERIIDDFSAGRTNVLIGTQMVTKGLDFDKVSVVGILQADNMLNVPDFRAYEQAFAMMAQVSGRAGRKGKQGLVVLQTKNPGHHVIQQVAANDLDTFYADLLEERKAFHYPPFYHLIYVYLLHGKDDIVNAAASYLGAMLRHWFGTRVLGPDKPAVARVKTQHIRKLVLKLEQGIDLPKVRQYLRVAQKQMEAEKRFSTVQMYYDVDPQ